MRAALSNPWRTWLLSWGPALSHRGGPAVCIQRLLDIPGELFQEPRDEIGWEVFTYIIMLILLPRDATTIPRRGVTNAFCRFEFVICERNPPYGRIAKNR